VDEPEAVAKWLADPDDGILDRNLERARAHYASSDLPRRLDDAFRAHGWKRG
jgi:hypothetical protein